MTPSFRSDSLGLGFAPRTQPINIALALRCIVGDDDFDSRTREAWFARVLDVVVKVARARLAPLAIRKPASRIALFQLLFAIR
eukprot:2520534-Prymnesium_polylepis.1